VSSADIKRMVPSSRYRRYIIEDYYRYVYMDIHENHMTEIYDALLVLPLKEHVRFFQDKYESDLSLHESWNLCAEYLKHIDCMMEALLVKHSIYYWMHLYRRIGVKLNEDHIGKTDPLTTLIVRNTLEVAITKYGNMTITDDICRIEELADEEILGGCLVGLLKKHITDINGRNEYLRQLRLAPQWVLKEFSKNDIINIYYLEGLSYEYWRMSAIMRSVGKGAVLELTKQGILISGRTDELNHLFSMYDERIELGMRYMRSLKGISFDNEKPSDEIAVGLQYNVEGRLAKELCPSGLGRTNIDPKSKTNFIWQRINTQEYARAHRVFDEYYIRAKGYPIEAVCCFLTAHCNMLSTGYASVGRRHEEVVMGYYNILQRGYIVRNLDQLKSVESYVNYYQSYGADRRHKVDLLRKHGAAIQEDLSLTVKKQESICLWSQGPRFCFIPHGEYVVTDTQGVYGVLETLFYGVPMNQDDKGTAFENSVREALAAADIDVLSERKLRARTGKEKEIDVGVRVADTLYILECRASERPLDYHLCKPSVIDKRNEYLSEKVDQVLSVVEFIQQTPVGRNYNFSWARKITGVVVSPFVEWIWSTADKKLWIEDEVARIMSVGEVIKYIKNSCP